MLAGTLLCIYWEQTFPIVFLGILSFASLISISNHHFTPQGKFGFANLLTLSRLLIQLLLTYFALDLNNYVIAGAGFFILLFDGIDGKVAKKRNELSQFGEYFDKETDALFLLSLCLISIFKQILWSWIIVIGLFRYLFGLFLFTQRKKVTKERRSTVGRYIYVFTILALLSSFLPFPNLYQPAVILAMMLLCYSFGKDFLWIVLKK
jgi:phosphatidylglycerophosphate synthase